MHVKTMQATWIVIMKIIGLLEIQNLLRTKIRVLIDFNKRNKCYSKVRNAHHVYI